MVSEDGIVETKESVSEEENVKTEASVNEDGIVETEEVLLEETKSDEEQVENLNYKEVEDESSEEENDMFKEV